jgi:hypothetical protein
MIWEKLRTLDDSWHNGHRLIRLALLCFVVVVGYLLPPCRAAFSAESVDLLLILAADVSYSIDEPQFILQRNGYAKAFKDKKVVAAIESGVIGRIGVTFIEWSGETWQQRVVDWTLINDMVSARNFAQKVLAAPRSFSERTSISGAIYFSIDEFDRAPFLSKRRIIDISANGDNNAGRSVTIARDEACSRGITINGLAIPGKLNGEHLGGIVADLGKYFETNVIGGPNAFVVKSTDYRSFGDALVRKLTREIAGADRNRYGGLMRNVLRSGGG